MKLETMRNFLDAHPATSGGDDYDATIRAWLATGEIEVEAGDGPPCTIVVTLVDYDGALHAYAIPNTQLDDQAHRDLDAVSGACFEWHFNGDLAPEQFAGAFRLFGGPTDELDVFEEQIEELREEMEDDAPDMDWDALRASAGSWNQYAIEPGATLPGPITRSYTARIAM